MTSKSDSVGVWADAVVERLRSTGVSLLTAALVVPPELEVVCVVDLTLVAEEAAATLLSLSPALVCHERMTFEPEDYEEITDARDSATDESRRERMEEAARTLKMHIGQTTSAWFSVLGGKAPYITVLSAEAEWAEFIPSPSKVNQVSGSDENTHRLPDTEIDRYANIIAQSPIYQSAKPGTQNYAARKTLGSQADEIPQEEWCRVASRALDIWLVDLKPARDDELRKRALTLLDAGKTKVKIAAELGLSAKQLANLIG